VKARKCQQGTLCFESKEAIMTLFEILLSASAVCLSSGAIAYSMYVVRNTGAIERPSEAQIQRMIDTAPRGRFDNALAR
jgi:hypothetical protein